MDSGSVTRHAGGIYGQWFYSLSRWGHLGTVVLLRGTLGAYRDSGSVMRRPGGHIGTVILLCAALGAYRDSDSVMRRAGGI